MVSQAQLLCKISHVCITTFGHCGEHADKFGSICPKTGNGSNHTFKNINKLVCTAITTYLKRICTSYAATCILSCSELISCNKLLSQHYPRVFHARQFPVIFVCILHTVLNMPSLKVARPRLPYEKRNRSAICKENAPMHTHKSPVWFNHWQAFPCNMHLVQSAHVVKQENEDVMP